jgi:hypothetical protein
MVDSGGGEGEGEGMHLKGAVGIQRADERSRHYGRVDRDDRLNPWRPGTVGILGAG